MAEWGRARGTNDIVRVRRLRWWHRLFDRELRNAMKTAQGAREFQVVDYTDDGVAITMPTEIADTWELLPLEVRARFMADIDATKADGGDPAGPHDWRA